MASSRLSRTHGFGRANVQRHGARCLGSPARQQIRSVGRPRQWFVAKESETTPFASAGRSLFAANCTASLFHVFGKLLCLHRVIHKAPLFCALSLYAIGRCAEIYPRDLFALFAYP